MNPALIGLPREGLWVDEVLRAPDLARDVSQIVLPFCW
jgi:hypothetical protein